MFDPALIPPCAVGPGSLHDAGAAAKEKADQVRSDVPGERCACDDGGISLTSQDKQVHLSISQSHYAPGDG